MPGRRRTWLAVLIATAALVVSSGVLAGRSDPLPGDGQISLARLRWGSDLRGFRRGGFSAAWNHDYPRAEQHLSMIIEDITLTDIRTDADVVVSLDDPRLFNYPIALMWEPGFWNLTDREARS